MQKPTITWLKEPLRFQCQGSGKCCTSRGEFGFVFLTAKDRREISRHLKLSASQFKKQYCDQTSGVWHLREEPGRADCVFLNGKACGIYSVRPTQCRTWPFWPEVMNAKSWKKDVVSFCPGIGKGPIWSQAEIQKQLEDQTASEEELLREGLTHKEARLK